MDEAQAHVGWMGKSPSLSSAQFGRLDLAIIATFSLLGGFLIAGSSATFSDGDTSWHIAAGRWMLANWSVPPIDPFSFSALGHRWIAHEWLSELLMGAAYDLGGFPAVGLLSVLSLATTLAIAGIWIRRWANPAELGLSLALILLSLTTFVLARPLIIAWPILAIWMVVLLREREQGDNPPGWWTVILMILWVNLHASWIIGVLLAGAFGLEAVIKSRDLRTAGRWLAYGGALIASTLINPNFTHTLLIPFQAVGSHSINFVQEFRPTDVSYTPVFEATLLVVLGVAWWRGARLASIRIVIMLAMLHLALAHMRHQALFLIVGAFILVPPLTRRWVAGLPIKPGLAGTLQLGQRGALILLLGGAVSFAAIGVARLAQPTEPLESTVNPVHAFAAIPKALRSEPVLNFYSLGGPLILRGIRPFIDGRGDVYGEQFLAEYLKIDSGDEAAFSKADSKWHFQWTILSPNQKPLLGLLDRLPQWRRLYADRYVVIHVRSNRPRVP